MKRIVPGRLGKMHMYVFPTLGKRPTLCNMNGNTHTEEGWVDCKHCLKKLGYYNRAEEESVGRAEALGS